jgi:GNAT superfamily N-acetyltransferase
LQAENHAYLAFLDETPVAYGWTALKQSGISGFRFSFVVPSRDCYLWDFSTLLPWRGRGIYPRLLQAIIEQEALRHHFWIGYEPGNEASARGISKAGFRLVCDLVISSEGRVSGLSLVDASPQARASASFFQLPILAGIE